MKKLLVAMCFACALALVANAQDKTEGSKSGTKHPAPTPEQKEARKALLEKYDTNKDGKLDKAEKAKISKEELEKAGYTHKKETPSKYGAVFYATPSPETAVEFFFGLASGAGAIRPQVRGGARWLLPDQTPLKDGPCRPRQACGAGAARKVAAPAGMNRAPCPYGP